MRAQLATTCRAALLLLAAATASAADAGAELRLRQLEDREAIRALFNDYGRLIDERRWEEFAALFVAEAEYGSTANPSRGPAAIRAQLEGAFRTNTLGVGEPNFHIFFNETIRLDGDRATATSKGAWVAPGADGRPQMVMLATYEDVLIRRDGSWKFLRRIVRGDLIPRRQK